MSHDSSRFIVSDSEAIAARKIPLWEEIFRWIVVLPGALLGSLIAYWFAMFGWWLMSNRFGDESWFYYLYREIGTNAILGAALVYSAAFIAPRGKIPVAVTFAGIILFFSSIPIFLFIGENEWVSLLGAISLNADAIIVATCIATGEIDM